MPNLFFPPAILFLVAAAIIPLLPGHLRRGFILLVPVVAFVQLTQLTLGSYYQTPFFDFELVLLEVSKLRLAFA